MGGKTDGPNGQNYISPPLVEPLALTDLHKSNSLKLRGNCKNRQFLL